jgi:hypothetical protein
MRLFGFKDVVFAVGQSNAVQCVRNRCASRIDSFCASALHSEVLPVLQGPARCGMRCCVGIGPPSLYPAELVQPFRAVRQCQAHNRSRRWNSAGRDVDSKRWSALRHSQAAGHCHSYVEPY